MNNKTLMGVAIIIVVIIVMSVVIVVVKDRHVTSVPLLKGMGDQFVIHVYITGTACRFLVDTGASTSAITQANVDKLMLSISDSQVRGAVTAKKKSMVMPMTEDVFCRIGDFRFMQDFAVWPSEVELDYDGILGADIINRFRWLFDFENHKVTLHRAKAVPFVAERRDSDYCWEIDFKFDFRQHPIMQLTLNDSIPAQFLMDTGWTTIEQGEQIITPEFWFMLPDSTDIVYKYMIEQASEKFEVAYNPDFEDPFLVFVSKELRINNSPPIHALVFVDFDEYYNPNFGVSGLVNRSLWLRHRQVIYDPFAKKIFFYKSPDDVTPYSDENTNVILNLIPDNEKQQD